jgi:hypothetical protein
VDSKSPSRMNSRTEYKQKAELNKENNVGYERRMTDIEIMKISNLNFGNEKFNE